jgi:ligand-binding sensor domain-containing protein
LNSFSRILFIFSFLFTTARAQDPHPSFRHYTVEDGLPSSEVYQVKQDSKGYIWFATGNGVSRFNGYEFENFSMSNGLPDNTVFEIFEDNTERIWFVPISCKLSYYYKGQIYQFKYNKELLKLINNPIKVSFAVDRKGSVFLGVFRDGIYEISPDGKITHHFGKSDEEVGLNIIQPDSNCLTYSTNLLKSSYKIRFNTPWIKGTATVPDNISEVGASLRIARTKENLTLMTCINKVYVFKSPADYYIQTFPKRVIWLYEDTQGDIWIGTYLGGVYHLENGKPEHAPVYLPNLPVNGIIEDKEGGYWFATEGNGVFYARTKNIKVFDESIGLKNNKVNAIVTDSRTVYAGVQNGFVHNLNDSILQTFDLNGKGKLINSISNLYYDKIKNRFLVAGKTDGGIIENNKFTLTNQFELFNKMVPDGEDNFWIATSMSLNKTEKGKKVFSSVSTTKQLKRINALVRKNDSSLLVGAVDGLYEFDTNQKNFNYLGANDSVLSNRVLDLAYLKGLLVIATKGKGVLIYDGRKLLQHIDSKNGLCGDNVYRLFIDGNNIWIATNKGINKVSLVKKEPLDYEIKSYTTLNGLSSNEINDILVLNGKTWAATNKGINVFDSESRFEPQESIPLYIDRIIVEDSVMKKAGEYELKHYQNNIRINFLGIAYRNAGKLMYRYRMGGLDTNWNYTQSREAMFTTLPPENYHFELQVLNDKGDPKGYAHIRFTIKSPFWQKWWFRLSVLIIISCLIFFYIKYRTDIIKRREMKTAELNRTLLSLKLKALRAQMNPHFTFNVMNSIQHFILNSDTESAHRYLSKFSKLIRTILNNSENNTIPLSEELKALELYIQLEAMRFDQSFRYEIIVDETINTMLLEIPSMLIQPYVENAIKHGILPLKQNGRLKIEILRQGRSLKCIIEDNGIGREKAGGQETDVQHRSMGTSITHERLNVINSLNNSNLSERIVDLKDEKGNALGTRVEIYIPID